MAERAKTNDPNTMDMDTIWSGNSYLWDEDKSTKKEEKGKGWDWSKSIQEMSFEEAQAWFKDYKNITKKAGKAYAQGTNLGVLRTIIGITSCPWKESRKARIPWIIK